MDRRGVSTFWSELERVCEGDFLACTGAGLWGAGLSRTVAGLGGLPPRVAPNSNMAVQRPNWTYGTGPVDLGILARPKQAQGVLKIELARPKRRRQYHGSGRSFGA